MSEAIEVSVKVELGLKLGEGVRLGTRVKVGVKVGVELVVTEAARVTVTGGSWVLMGVNVTGAGGVFEGRPVAVADEVGVSVSVFGPGASCRMINPRQ